MQLLQRVIDKYLPDRLISDSSILKVDWLQKVWLRLNNNNVDLSVIQHLPILPLLSEGSYNGSHIAELVSLSSGFLFLQNDGVHPISDDVCACLKQLGIQIITQLPGCVPLEKIKQFIYTGSYDDVCRLMNYVASSPSAQTFNCHCSELNRAGFVDFVSFYQTSLQQTTLDFLAKLKLFTSVGTPSEPGTLSSLSECRYFIEESNIKQFPEHVSLPTRCLKLKSCQRELVTRMNGIEMSVIEFMDKSLDKHVNCQFNAECGYLMSFFQTNFAGFKLYQSLINKAKQVNFVFNGYSYVKAAELFDSSDEQLSDLLMNMPVFPTSDEYIQTFDFNVLRQLGIKTIDSVQASDVVAVAERLDRLARQMQTNDAGIQRNSIALMKLLDHKPCFLNSYVNGQSVGQILHSLSWVRVEVDVNNYPSCLTSYKHPLQLCMPSEPRSKDSIQLIGSTMPIVKASVEVSGYFGWNLSPPVTKVVEQLRCIRRSCPTVTNRPDILPLLRTVYGHMVERIAEFQVYKQAFTDEQLVWTDDGFMSPAQVVTERDDRTDITIRPYASYIPQEFQMWRNLFEMFGCYTKQNVDILINTLETIRDKYCHDTVHSGSVDIDRHIVVNILVRLAELRKETIDFQNERVLIMVHDDDDSKIRFAQVNKCVYDDEEEYLDSADDDCERKYVHPDIRLEVAKALGVESLSRRSLLDTEDVGLEECGQKENLTSRLNTLLNEGYTDGLSVLKEMIQNADDAGASTVKLLYDERRNENYKKRLFSPDLCEFQGPALWVYNDATFTSDDLNNITKLNGATKKENTSTIGKFGLGFCSVYNLTDVPSFISGDHLVLFDPHESYIKEARNTRATGLKIKLSNRTLVRRHVDQFKPFEDIFGCKVVGDNFQEFGGTLFRLPLRTAVQADRSYISKKVYTRDETRSLLKMFIQAAGNTLLFSQNVQNLQIYHLPEDATSPVELVHWFSSEKECTNLSNEKVPRLQSRILERASMASAGLSDSHIVKLKDELFPEGCQTLGLDTKSETMEWLVSWAMPEWNPHSKRRTDALPLAAIASPLEGECPTPTQLSQLKGGTCYKRGHLFCFMPLPLPTNLQFHINGCFEVRSDRRDLMSSNEDDIIGNKSNWNDLVMGTTVVKAFIDHLEVISNMQGLSDSYTYDVLWPRNTDQNTEMFVHNFYNALLSTFPAVFKGHVGFVSFQNAVFLDPAIDSQIRSIATEMISRIPIDESKQVVKLDSDVLSLLYRYNTKDRHVIESATVRERSLLLHFLDNIDHSFFEHNVDQRNVLLRYAITRKDDMIDKKLKSIPCIPTQPNGNLEMINCLVHPDREVAILFSQSDGRFPSTSFIINSSSALQDLVRLGMNDSRLTDDLLLDRVHSIETKASECATCAKEQIKHVMSYLRNRDVVDHIKNEDWLLQQLQACFILPVKDRPTDWKMSWKTDDERTTIKTACEDRCEEHNKMQKHQLLIGQPTSLFRQACSHCVGSIEYIMDETFMVSQIDSVLQALSVKSRESITFEMLLQQLDIVSDELESTSEHSFVQKVCEDIYKYMHACIQEMSEEKIVSSLEQFKTTLSKPIILVGERLVKPSSVIVLLQFECHPDLYQFPFTYRQYKPTLLKLGVRENLTVQDILEVLDEKKNKWDKQVCEEIRNIGNLLENLHICMRKQNIELSDLQDDMKRIVAPDQHGYLVQTQELSLDDREFETTSKVRLLHSNCVTTEIAKAVGVRSKKQGVVRLFSKMMPFGQKEKLYTRLNGLLKDYPCDESIMKELIQNADDAGATEIFFIKHFETKELRRPFGSENIRGPALCVYNNSFFTEDDFKGIQNLGIGSKSDDPLKTGQYGIGFNAVYHLTDVPSFLSKAPGQSGDLCIFDPLLKSIGSHISEECPGLRCDVAEMMSNFEEVLSGYQMIDEDRYTMFRMPLRNEPSQIKDQCLTYTGLESILEQFAKEMKECLHFLRNITCIKIMTYKNGTLTEEHSVSAVISISDCEKRKHFFDKVAAITKENATSKENLLEEEPFDVTYTLNLTDQTRNKSEWLVVNRFGFDQPSDNEQRKSIQEAFKQKELGLLPFAGVSIELDKCKANTEVSQFPKKYHTQRSCEQFRSQSGTAFCFLPLPVCIGLPFHVNGHFAVDRSRRSLLTDGVKKLWNEKILQDIVVEAVHSMLLFLQTYLVDNVKPLKRTLDVYDSILPLVDHARDEFWKLLVKEFYETAYTRSFLVFPVVTMSEVLEKDVGQHTDSPRISVQWTRLAKDLRDFDGGVFNIANLHIQKFLKAADIKILAMSMIVKKTVETCRRNSVISTCPDFVQEVLKSNMIKASGYLEDTTFRSLEIFQNVLKYVMKQEHFKENVKNLPLNLGNDGILRSFNGSESVFCSEWCDLVTGSADAFLHKSIVGYLGSNKELFENGLLKSFGIDELLQLLPDTLHPELFRTGQDMIWRKDENKPLSQDFIRNLFWFICEQSSSSSSPSGIHHVDHNLFKKNLGLFDSWSVLPSVTSSKSHINILIPVEKSHTLLIYSRGNEPVSDVLKKMHIPTLDTKIFSESKDLSDRSESSPTSVIYPLKKLMSSTDKPDMLLKCLYHYRDKIASCNINVIEATKMLSFFSEHLGELQKSIRDTYTTMLRALPLFQHISGELKSIGGQCVVVPGCIPTDGLADLLDGAMGNYVKENDMLKSLFADLGIKVFEEVEFYANVLMPKFQQLPESTWIPHIEYIKKNLMYVEQGKTMNWSQQKIIHILTNIPFIEAGHLRKCACDFFDEDCQVFSCMLSDDCFLPVRFKSWKGFLKLLGFNMYPTGSMVLSYAKTVAREAATNGINDIIERKSHTLCHYLINESDWKKTFGTATLNEIKTVKFVCPYHVHPSKSSMCKPFVDPGMLICFDESVCELSESICWTSVSLLKKSCMPSDQKFKAVLGILDSPHVKHVIKHSHNVTENIKHRMTISPECSQLDRDIMETIYIYLQDNREFENEKHKLLNTPFVLIPDENIVSVKEVLPSTAQEEIKPYLYKIPACFMKYFDLFSKIGAEENVTCGHYASVLEKISTEFKNRPVPPNKMECVRKAIAGLLLKLRDFPSDNDASITKDFRGKSALFLPDMECVMQSAVTLTISDNPAYEKILKDSDCDISWFVGFEALKLNVVSEYIHYVDALRKLPNGMQPSILTDSVEIRICMDELSEVPLSRQATKWEDFLRSREFIEGIVRLLKHEGECNTEYVIKSFAEVCVLEVKGLATFVWFRGNRLDGSHTSKACFLKETNTGEHVTYSLFFQLTDDENVIDVLREDDGIYSLIDKCTNGKLSKKASHFLEQMLSLIDNPSKIKEKLDLKKVTPFELNGTTLKTVFPEPGTFVEPRFLPFLVASITPFQKHEFKYLAMELNADNNEDSDTEEDPSFIYVNIIEELPRLPGTTSVLGLRYLVEVGERVYGGTTEVPVYQLYQFVSQQTDVGTDVQLYDTEPTSTVPFDENCRRVREMLKEAWQLDESSRRKIILRLILRWHPDKNKGQEEYATRVFNYIKEIIVKLERNESVDGDISDNTGRSSPNMSGSRYEHFSTKCSRTAQAYTRAYHKNYDSYSRSSRTGDYVHRQTYQPVCRRDESRRWFRQAKHDFAAAKAALSGAEDVKGYNWICYNCHQVSHLVLVSLLSVPTFQ